MPAIATNSRKRVRVRKFHMARLGGNRARALFQVMPVPLGSSMTGAGRPLRAPSGVDTPRTLLLRWRTVGSATMETVRQIPSRAERSQALQW